MELSRYDSTQTKNSTDFSNEFVRSFSASRLLALKTVSKTQVLLPLTRIPYRYRDIDEFIDLFLVTQRNPVRNSQTNHDHLNNQKYGS